MKILFASIVLKHCLMMSPYLLTTLGHFFTEPIAFEISHDHRADGLMSYSG
ncbi:hypothetical protein ACSG7X_000129 [Vibrio fluvialis]